MGLLRAFGVIPDEKWTEVFPLAAFYSLLFFWQHLRELFLRPLVVFLDRLCIAQHDDKLKEQGGGPGRSAGPFYHGLASYHVPPPKTQRPLNT